MNSISFQNNKAATAGQTDYIEITVDTAKTLASWQTSMFAHQWLDKDGKVKELGELSEKDQAKRNAVEAALAKGEAITKPVLGIGIADNVEIGSAKAEFLTLAAKGLKEIPVHIPKSSEKDFKAFLASIN